MCLFSKEPRFDDMTPEQRAQYVQELIDNAPEVDQDGNTALMRAASKVKTRPDDMTPEQRAQLVQYLIDNAPEVDQDGNTALMYYAINSDKEVVELLLSKSNINDNISTHLKLD